MSSSALIAAENALARATRALGAAALRGGANYAARKIQRRFRKNKSRRRKGRKTRSDTKDANVVDVLRKKICPH